MTAEHKAALAEGRKESRALKSYLDALDEHRPRRGRKRTKESIGKRLADLETEIPATAPLKRVKLIQERMDLAAELEAMSDPVDLTELEAGFVEHAKAFSERKGISYAAWREVGVSAATLKKAGIGRGS